MSTPNADSEFLQRLRDGDETAFESLIERHHGDMVRLARAFVDDRSTAEEVVQETWMAVIDGLEGFEGRSSLKTWMFRILSNLAKKRGERDARTVAWSALSEESLDREVSEEGRFNTEGRWSVPPTPWKSDPEEDAMQSQLLQIVEQAIRDLPESQRAVVTMRDVQGWPSDEVCEVLEITPGNQRVLLHRARSSVREALESALGHAEEGAP